MFTKWALPRSPVVVNETSNRFLALDQGRDEGQLAGEKQRSLICAVRHGLTPIIPQNNADNRVLLSVGW